MADVHSPETRSYNMSRIKGKDTKPEMIVRKFLFSKGFRYRLHVKNLPGKPDIVLPKYKTVIFIHGCFWHGHDACKYSTLPQTRVEWWKTKIMKNKQNDRYAYDLLNKFGWRILIVWTCSLKPANKDLTLSSLLEEFK